MRSSILLLALCSTGISATRWSYQPRMEARVFSNSSNSAVTVPSPTQPGIATDCVSFYLPVQGEDCSGISQKHNIATSQFISWNPSVGADCQGLKAGFWACVRSIASSSKTSSETPKATQYKYNTVLAKSNSTTNRTAKKISLSDTLTGTKVSSVPTPNLGTQANCDQFYKVNTNDTCDSISMAFGTFTTDTFLKWNSKLIADCTNLILDSYTCVGISGCGTSTTNTTTTPATLEVVQKPSGSPSAPVMPGTPECCKKFSLVKPGDDCNAVATAAGISASMFISLNPRVGPDCKSLLAGDLACVGA